MAELHSWDFAVVGKDTFETTEQWRAGLGLGASDACLLIYAVNKTYVLNAPHLAKKDLFRNHRGGDPETIAYSMTFTVGDPGDFFVDDSGKVLVRPRQAGNDTGKLTARDLSGAELLGKAWPVEIRPEDTEVPEHGPNKQGCNDGSAVDGTGFDRSFTCDCSKVHMHGRQLPNPPAGPIVGQQRR